jgi:hypothetical protein
LSISIDVSRDGNESTLDIQCCTFTEKCIRMMSSMTK